MSNIKKQKIIKTLEEQTNSLNTEVNRIQIKKDLSEKELIYKKEKFNTLVREKNIDIKKLEEVKGEISLEVLSIKEKKNKAFKEKQSIEKEVIVRKERLSTLNDSINIIVYEDNKREAEYKTKLKEIEKLDNKADILNFEMKEKEKNINELSLKNENKSKENEINEKSQTLIKKELLKKEDELIEKNIILVDSAKVLDNSLKSVKEKEDKLVKDIELYNNNIAKYYEDKTDIDEKRINLGIREDKLNEQEQIFEENNINLTLRERNFKLKEIEVEAKEKELKIMAKKFNADNLK